MKIQISTSFQNHFIYSNKIFILFLNQIIVQSGFYLILYPRSKFNLGIYHFNPIPIQFKIKTFKGNLQCDNWDGVKVNKQAITTININPIINSNNPEITVLIRIVICAN